MKIKIKAKMYNIPRSTKMTKVEIGIKTKTNVNIDMTYGVHFW